MNEAAVLIVEDDTHLREALLNVARESCPTVLSAANGAEALALLDGHDVGLVISDLQMQPVDGLSLLRSVQERRPGLPTVLMTAFGTIESAVEGIQLGAADYLVKPFEADVLTAVINKFMRPQVDVSLPVAVDENSLQVLSLAKRVAQTEATVSLCGESGTGKEVLARYIHQQSDRANKPFIAINCAAIPDNMLEAVLFGYEKGAFTGADKTTPGKFEQADGGTLLLDEITEMDLGLQAKLLRVLQEKEVERLGGRRIIPLDVRVLSTTNRDFKDRVRTGDFREDLYYRLNVFPLHIPPLRERRADIRPLAEFFLANRAGCRGVELTDAAVDALTAYDWPGNVRELDNLVQRTAILLNSRTIDATDLAFEESTCKPAASGLQQDVESHEFELIANTLRAVGGKRGDAAKRLNISPRTLRYKLAKMRDAGIDLSGDVL